MHFSCLPDLENQPYIATVFRPLVKEIRSGEKNHLQETTQGVASLVVKFFVSFKIRLNHFNKLIEQVFVFHGKKFLDLLAVLLGFDNLHDIEINGFFFLIFSVVVAMLALTVTFAIMGFAQHNVFFTVVEEIAHDFQQNIVPILIYTFDEVAGIFFGGYAAHRLIIAVQRYRPTFFACFPSPGRDTCVAVSSHPAAKMPAAMVWRFLVLSPWFGFIITQTQMENKAFCENFIVDFCKHFR